MSPEKRILLDRVIQLEVAHRVQEMRRHGLQLAVAERDRLAAIGQRDDAVVGADAVAEGQVVGRQVRQEARPQLGTDHPRPGVQQPLVQRGDDVRVLVRGEDVGQRLHRDVLGQLQRQRGVGSGRRPDRAAGTARGR